MTDREKVIKGLERFIADFKPFCGNKPDWQRVEDALALLKAQEPRVMTKEEVIEATGTGGDTVVNKKDGWHHERRIGEAVKAGIKCFCGGEAYRDILEVTMNGEAFPRVHRIFCPNCGLQMRSPAGNDEDFIVRQWRDISDLHQHRKEEQERADRSGVLKKIAQYFQEWSGAENTVAKLAFGPSELRVITAWYTNMISWRQRLDVNNEKQNPRVMSLQEIEAGEFDFAYLEYRVDGSDEFIDSIIKPVLIVWTLNNGIGMMHADNADLTEWKDEYKKTFRLWTAMPRPEYRKAAKWE